MKLFYILLFLYVLSVNAQRRTTPKSESTEAEPAQRITSRGRTRFSAPHDIPQNEQRSSENTVRRTTRKRIEPVATFERRAPTKSDSINRSYEVEETVEDSPIDSFRRQSKPRVLTETHFEAQNAPKRTLFRPHPTTEKLDVDDLIKNFGSNTVEANPPKTSEFSSSSTTSRTESSGDLTFSEEITTDSQQTDLSKFDEEIRKQTETKSSTSPPTENKRNSNHRRVNVRTRVNTPTETVTTAKTRTRTRVNVNRKPIEAVSSTSSPATHASRIIHRRRGSERSSPENSSRGPSVFSAEETQGSPSRSRTGRRIDNQAPEKITLDLPISTRGRSRTRSQPSSSTTERYYDRNSRRRTSSRFQSNASTSTVKPTTSIRNRSRTRPLLPTVDEKNFEVLPLFESESKIVRPNYHSKEIELSATEDNVHYAKPDNKSNLVSSRVSVSVETRTESSFRRKPYSRKSKVKESIVSEISEVTSKRTVSRRRNNALPITESKVNTRVKVDAPKVTFSQVVTSSRGRKKSEINLNEVKKKKNSLSSSEEEITDSDNYPAAFKALIQAKKSNKESRPSKLPTSVTSEKVVTSSSTEASSTVSTTTVTKSDTIKEDDFDNELIPQSSTTTTQRPIRQRSTTLPRFSEKPKQRQSLPSRNPTKNTFKSTTANPEKHISKEPHRFHAKFTTTGKSDVKVDKIGRTYTPKPPRGIYSSKNKEINIRNRTNKNVIETAAVSTQIPKSGSFKKSNRYSSRYRSDISSRGRSTTSAPAYIPTIPTAAYVPTIPTVTPPIAVKLGEAYKDNDLGLEVITFDDPVNTVPSANLVSGEYYDAQNNSVTVVSKAVTTEKPVSIIERIINSITAISTTSSPELKSQPVTTVTSEPTRGSAILKLATKKPTKLDKTVDETKTVLKQSQTTSTSEKPTTVIERILNSLSAIQANDQSNDIQVGNDFNTISSPSTTPISRITKSATITSLSAPQSTSINPLSVFDEISEEQTLQKRTIGKLLALLNGLTTTVSPRTATTASNQGSSSSTNSTTELFTSPIPSVSTESQSPPSLDLQLDQRSSFAVTTESSSQTVTDSAPPTTTTITNTETTVVSTETLGTTPQTTVNINEISSADMTPNPLSRNIPESTTDLTSALGVLSLFVSPRITSNLVESTTPSLSSDFVGTTTETGITDTNTFFTIPSTIPTLTNFEVDDARNAKSLFVSNPLPAQSGNNTTENVNATTEASSTESSSVGNVETTTISTGNTISSTSGSTMVPTPRPTIPTLSELLNGKTLEAFNDIINNSNPSSNEVSSTTANYQTLQVNQWNQVLNIQDLLNMNRMNNVVYRWKPVTRPNIEIQQEISSTSSNEPDTETPASSTEGPLINTSSIPDITTTLSSSTEGLITTPIYSTTTRLTMTPIETLSQSASTTISSSDISNRILDNSISTTASPSTTTASSTTEVPVTVQPTVTTVRTTTSFPVPTTFFPMLFSTILSTLQPRITTNPPISSFKTTTVPTTETTNLVTAQTEPIPSASTPIASTITPRRGKVAYFDTITTTEEIATTTAIRRIRTTTTTPLPTTRIRTTQAPTTTTTTERPTTRTTETTTNTLFTSANIVARSSTAKPKLKQLTEEQRKNLETLAQLEKEQASILQQLSFLTNLNLGGNKPNNNKATTERSNLANRIIALAMDRDKARTSTPLPNSIQDVLSSTDNRQGKKLSSTSESKSPSLEEVLKQYNVSGLSTNTPSSPLTSTYGKSNDALLAALLKEQGIGPTTPKGLGSIYSETTTTRRPKPTTRAPGRLMQGLNWLLNALAPPTTRKPRTKPRKLPEELLTNQPTHITPVVTAAPTGKVFSPNSLSQEDIGKLIKQLEAIQKDPKKNELDFSQINSLQHLLNNNEGVQIITPPKAGTTSKIAPTKESFFSSTQTERLTTRARIVKSTTASPSTVDNSLDDEEIYTTPRPRMSLPPVRLRPVPGIDENSDPLIRGNLITAAVNVTRAISSFLGSALQDAAHQFTRMFSSGSSNVNDSLNSSSLANLINSSANLNPSG